MLSSIMVESKSFWFKKMVFFSTVIATLYLMKSHGRRHCCSKVENCPLLTFQCFARRKIAEDETTWIIPTKPMHKLSLISVY